MIDQMLAASYRAHRLDHELTPWQKGEHEQTHTHCLHCGLPLMVARHGDEWVIAPSLALSAQCRGEIMVHDPYAALYQAYLQAATAYEVAFEDALAGPCAEACRALAIYYDSCNPAVAATYRTVAEGYDAWYRHAA
jgi:hypothetical protein